MEPEAIQALFRFNTFANESLREPLLTAGEELARRPRDMWFGSVFEILAHVCGGESVWLARLRDRNMTAPSLAAADFSSLADLVERWREVDAQWEAFAASLSQDVLDQEIVSRRRDGISYVFKLWQPIIHVANHSTEHRGHATVAMTQLGIPHANQDFLDQFRTRAPVN
jgi:uncharacterized damage-inducible protein DinB